MKDLDMEFRFRTKEFRIDHVGNIDILRGGFPIEHYREEQIGSIVLDKGIRTKYPIRSLVSGIILATLSIYIVVYFAGFYTCIQLDQLGGHTSAFVLGYPIMLFGFSLGLSILFIRESLQRVPRLIIKSSWGKVHICPLNIFIKKYSLITLSEYLSDFYSSVFESRIALPHKSRWTEISPESLRSD